MKKNLLWFFGLLLVAGTISFSSCTEDLCKDVDCGANGECFEGSCVCNQGFEGTNCETEWSAKFLGNWSVQDSVKGDGTYIYTASITRLSESKLQVENFGGFSGPNSVDLNLTDGTTITAENFTDLIGRNFTFKTGSSLAGSKITINYTVTDGTKTDEGTAVFSK